MGREVALLALWAVALPLAYTDGTAETSALTVPIISSASPAAPFACEAGKEGRVVYVNDTDDALAGSLCACANTAGGGFDWISVTDVSAVTGLPLACPFF